MGATVHNPGHERDCGVLRFGADGATARNDQMARPDGRSHLEGVALPLLPSGNFQSKKRVARVGALVCRTLGAPYLAALLETNLRAGIAPFSARAARTRL